MSNGGSFDAVLARAAKRKGGREVLFSLLGPVPDGKALAAERDDRILALMTKCIFRSGFVWRVIEDKWPGFEAAFEGFEPRILHHKPDEFWDRLTADARIVRNGAKIMAVRHNAAFVLDVAREHGSFGRFLAAWPETDITGLWDVLAKRGSRLGGMTGRYFVRFAGKDSIIPSRDVVAALRQSGLDLPETPTARRDLKAIEARFNAWHAETGLPYTHLSRIAAMSAGENYDPESLRSRGTAVMEEGG
jgi:3-methyladenine DNA glycosylase Tag